MDNRINLTKLYKSIEVRALVWNCLCPEFERRFDNLMTYGEKIESRLVVKARAKKFWMKELFVEFGLPLNNLGDVKYCLEILKNADDMKGIDVIDSAKNLL